MAGEESAAREGVVPGRGEGPPAYRTCPPSPRVLSAGSLRLFRTFGFGRAALVLFLLLAATEALCS